jgi:hypothetical protein
MIVLALSAIVYFFLFVLTPALLWKSAKQSIDSQALKDQLQKLINGGANLREKKLNVHCF